MTRFPIGLAETAGLEGFKNAEGFIYRAADVQTMNYLILENTIGIDDEEAAQSDALVFQKNAEIAADIFGDVGSENVFDGAEAAIFVSSIDPGAVAVNAVYRYGEDFSIGFFEFFMLLRESLQFGRANEGEIERIEEENEPFHLCSRPV